MKITIPASVEDATAALNGLDQLLTAGEWKRMRAALNVIATP